MHPKKVFTKEQVYQKLRHYCAYQDRCHSEVKAKAFTLGMRRNDSEELTSRLIEEGCLNEERYARSFAGGKFRMKQWGRLKIKAELKKKQVSSYCIAAALDEIDEHKYRETLHKQSVKRWNSIKGIGVNHFVKMTKTRDYLLLKGYEPAFVAHEIRILFEKSKGAG
ncbi:MAG TPA: RecX family transcriptional regulator [Chitinophagaceae bacterium]|nr:RecX family transcriptional regulator [Chitinophagaceae bacterium]